MARGAGEAAGADRLLGVAGRISDGSGVDWDELRVDDPNSPEARTLHKLRLVDQIAQFHRSLDLDPPATPPLRPTPVRAIGHWGPLSLIEKLASGGFGEVFRARDERLGRDVALKLLRAREGSESTEEQLQEARHLARVRHPNIVTVHGAELHDGRVGLWMELLDGRTLEEQLVEQGPLSAAEATVVGLELCRALAALHQVGLLHRDIKAENVMRAGGGRIVLMDLGLGEQMSDASAETFGSAGGVTGSLRGSPFYLAPELLERRPPDARVDLYALGVLLYRLVTAQFPIEAKTFADIRAAHRDHRYVSLRDRRADLEPGLVRVIERAMAANPDERFATAGEMERALSQLQTGSLGAEPPRERTRPGRPALSRLVPGLISAVLILGLLLGLRAFFASRVDYELETRLVRVSAGDQTETLAPGARVRVGDFLGIEVDASRSVFMYVLTEDEHGESYLLFPLPGFDQQNPISDRGSHRLPGTVHGEPLFWQVSSAGGRERFLVVASPKRLPELEQLIAALDVPEEGHEPEIAAKLSDTALARLRGIGKLGVPAEGDGTSIFDAASRLTRGPEKVRGIYARRIELENPGP